jgi:hypothetical protein
MKNSSPNQNYLCSFPHTPSTSLKVKVGKEYSHRKGLHKKRGHDIFVYRRAETMRRKNQGTEKQASLPIRLKKCYKYL